MSDDATNWVTVKIHEQVRDAARDDSRTYTEIMQAGMDAGDTQHKAGANLDTDVLAERTAQAMDTGTSVDEKTLAEYVADYLVAEADLPRKVAEEVTGR